MKKIDRNNSDELRQTLFEELRTLRQTVREAGEGFVLRKEGEIEALLSYLREMRPAQVEKFGRSWLRESRDLSIKPTKGRIKDLRRLDALLEDLLSRVIEVDAPAEKKTPAHAKGARTQPDVINSAATSVSGEL